MSASEEQIAKAENHFKVHFPQDYQHFLGTEGSTSRFVPPAGDFLTLDSVTELAHINEAGNVQERFPGAVVIGGDGSREFLAYDFRQEPPTLALLDTAAPDWSSAIHQAASLSALFKQFPETGWKWDDESENPPA
ncbi:SMI1/KNR4 family protein [Streptomyces brevispora]|uniref:SMI1/KNR4 family protein n=1 Tax=Streptomyces brevispora TaxID=887462 RepID=UPI002E35B41A|nr:SMI1/KNR4 family protein [Streptomyces brevispora]